MSTTPLRSQVLRGAAVPPLVLHRLEPVDALAHGLDGRPIADDLLRARQAAAERGHAEGYAAGYAQGRAEGEASARLEAEAAYAARLVPAVAAVAAARSALEERDAVALAEIERAVVALAVDIAEAILQRELADRSAASEALRRALALVPARGEVVARLHPDDLAIVAEHGGVPGREVALVADQAVERGGAVVEVGPCRIDAQVGPALDRVRSALGVALRGEVVS